MKKTRALAMFFTVTQLACCQIMAAPVFEASEFNVDAMQDAEARAGFAATFDHELNTSWIGACFAPRINRPLTASHRNLIFAGEGPRGLGGFGRGNATNYTVNVCTDTCDPDPDLYADMNNIDHLAHLPSAWFDVIIAGNIPISCFVPEFFFNARRLLRPGGHLLLNTLDTCDRRNTGHQYIPITLRDDYLAIDHCLELFGFESAREQLNEFRGRLEEVGFTEDNFPFEEPVDVDPCVIYQKV